MILKEGNCHEPRCPETPSAALLVGDVRRFARREPGWAQGVSRKDLEALRFTEMEIFIFLISILVVLKLEKEVWKASLPLRQDSKAYTSSDGYC